MNKYRWKGYIFRLLIFLSILALTACNGSNSNGSGSQESDLGLQSNPGQLSIEELDVKDKEDVGQYTSIALDKGNPPMPMVSYYENIDEFKGNLKLCSWGGTDYVCNRIDKGGDYYVGKYTSIDVDSKGCAHISYQGANLEKGDYGLKYIKVCKGEPKFPESVPVEVISGMNTSIELDSNEFPWISFLTYNLSLQGKPYEINLAWKDGSGWHSDRVDDLGSFTLPGGFKPNGFTSLEIRSYDKKKMVSYYDLAYSEKEGEEVDRRNLKFACGEPGNWKISEPPIDSNGDVGKWSSLALYKDQPYITYYDFENRAIKLATGKCGANCNCSFTTEIVLIDSLDKTKTDDGCSNTFGYPCYFGPDNALTFDENGIPYIAFIESTGLDLKIADKKDGIWHVSDADVRTAPGIGGVGLYPSIVARANPQTIFIAYYHSFNYGHPVTRDGNLYLYSGTP